MTVTRGGAASLFISHSAAIGDSLAMTCWRALQMAAAILAGSGLQGGAAERRRPVCLSEAETRLAVEQRKMIPPVRAVEAAQKVDAGESVSMRLCHDDATMIYDIAILRPDGRLVHVLIDAGTGGLAAPRPAK